MPRRPLVGLFVTAAIALLLVFTASHAGAHTEVQRATPGPGEVVAGSVDQIRLQFLDPVLPSVRIAVRTPEGPLVPGLGVVEHSDDGRTATVDFTAIATPGDYVVEYEYVALDGDPDADEYRFSVVPSNADGGRSVLGPVALGIAGVVLVGALVLALRRRSVVDRSS